MQISVAFPSNLAMFRFCFPLLLSLPLSSSLLSSATVNEQNGLTYPTSLVRRKERGGGRERREATRWIEGRERRERSRADRRRSGIHFEIASHPVRSPFSTPPLLVSRHPPAVFSPASSLRKSHSSCSTHPASLALSRVSLPFGSQHARLEYWYRAKVLFPLNRAATRNNALYVRVLRLSPLAPRFVARLFLSRSDHSNLLRVPPVSILFLLSFRQILSMYSNLSRNTQIRYIFNLLYLNFAKFFFKIQKINKTLCFSLVSGL